MKCSANLDAPTLMTLRGGLNTVSFAGALLLLPP